MAELQNGLEMLSFYFEEPSYHLPLQQHSNTYRQSRRLPPNPLNSSGTPFRRWRSRSSMSRDRSRPPSRRFDRGSRCSGGKNGCRRGVVHGACALFARAAERGSVGGGGAAPGVVEGT
jgi:hypothetical protein